MAKELGLSEPDVELLLVEMILDRRIDGQIDQINAYLQLDSRAPKDRKYLELAQWGSVLEETAAGLGRAVG